MRLAASLLACTTACSPAATLHRLAAPSLEAEIADADEHFVYVSDHRGQLYEVPRASVSHVDHPGNWLVAVGALLVVMGASIAMEDREPDETEESYRNGRRAAWALFVTPGVLMAGWGGFTWTRSWLRERRRGPVRGRRLPIVVPADVVLAPGTPLAPPPPPAPAVPAAPIVPEVEAPAP